MSALRPLLLVLLTLLLLAVIALGALLATPAGLQAGLWLADRIAPGNLRVSGVEGRLLDRFSIRQLRYQDGELDIRIEALAIDWQPGALLEACLTVNRLAADTIDVSLPAQPATESESTAINLPLAIDLQQLAIGKLQLHTVQGERTIGHIRLNAHTEDQRVMIETLRLHADIGDVVVQLDANGNISVQSPWQHELTGHFSVRLPERPQLDGTFQSHGSLQALIAKLQLDAPDVVTLDFRGENLLGERHWQAALQTDGVKLSPWLDTASELVARLEARGHDSKIEATLKATATGEIEQSIQLDTVMTLESTLESMQALVIEKLHLQSRKPSLQAELSGRIDYGAGLQLDITGDWSLQSPQATGHLLLTGNLDTYQLELGATTKQPLISDWQLIANGTRQSLTIDTLLGRLAQGRVEAAGHIDWQQTPDFRLHGNWRDIVIASSTLPAEGPATDESSANELPSEPLQLPQGQFEIDGSPQDYRLQGSGRIAGAALPDSHWQVTIHGSDTQARIEPLTLQLLEGEIQLNGQADWSDAATLTAEVEFDAINPGAHWPDWPGRLHGGSRLRFEQTETAWQATLAALDIDGTLRGYPLSASGAAAIGPDHYRFDQLQIQVADSRLSANGSLAQDSRLRFTFHSPALGQLWPAAEGRVQVKGQLSGAYHTPRIVAEIQAADVRTPWLDVASLNGSGNINIATDQFELTVKAENLRREEQLIEALTLDGNGRLSAHNIELDVQLPERRLTLAGAGSWRDEVWSLRIAEGRLQDPLVGDWHISKPLQLSVQREQIQATDHCWQQSAGTPVATLCLGGDWQAAGNNTAGVWHGWLELEDYQLRTWAANKSDQPTLTGQLTTSLEARGTAAKLQQAQGNIRLRDVQLQTDSDTTLQIGQLIANIDGDGGNGLRLTLDGTFSEPAPGNLSGQLQTGAIQFDDLSQTTINGQFQANVDDLQPWFKLYPRFAAEQAALAADFQIGGVIGEPSLDGTLSLSAVDFAIPELGITLATLQLDVGGQPRQALTLQGRAISGPGSLTVDGRVTIENGALVVPEMRIRGERFELLHLPEIQALVTPDLSLAYRDQLLTIEGRVRVPQALIQPFAAPAVIPVSADEIIINEEHQTAATTDIEINARIELELGDEVRVTGNGFESRLAGNLTIHQSPGKPASANGVLNLVEGGYSAYGQELEIREGEIIFTNQPIDNPALNVEAVRNIDDVTVGIRASGTAVQPQTELFSTPPMPQADILSYLVTGRPLGDTGSGDGDALLRAAASMGLKQTESIQKTIADTFGIDTLSVDTGTTDDGETGAQLTIGKYLAPNLYISYGAGLVDSAVNTIKLRYDINRHLSLEAEQGAGTGVDLLYQIESGDPWD